MVDPVTGAVLVFNGEIYNYTALRDDLVAQGESFHSSGDTAVMLRALSILGAEVRSQVPWNVRLCPLECA